MFIVHINIRRRHHLPVKRTYIHTGCPTILGPLCFFVIFLSSGAHIEELLTFIQTALAICYMIATRILKIVSEIIEVKNCNCNTKIIFIM